MAIETYQLAITLEDPNTTRTFTPNNFGTISQTAIYSYRIGKIITVYGHFKCGVTAAAVASITLPVNIDTTKFADVSGNVYSGMLGFYNEIPPAAGPFNLFSDSAMGVIFFDGSTANAVYFAVGSSAMADSAYSKGNANGMVGTNGLVKIQFSYPVA